MTTQSPSTPNPRPPQASILAVGTELTTGQITNRNAAWLSEKLVNLGIEVLLHETVADDRLQILNALDRCSKSSQFVLVTGGLGPTTDDFTREVIAEFLGQPLEFDEASWQEILKRLSHFGISAPPSNRRQCFFPKGSRILPNSQGTAAGFMAEIEKSQGRMWVFPGPPLEVAAVWNPGAEQSIRQLLPDLKPLKLFTWGCMGRSEAEFGELTEKVLSGSGLQTGYRAHRPIVEMKVWCPEQDLVKQTPWIQKLEEALKPWIFVRQGEDLAENLVSKLQHATSVEIIDSCTGGILAQRLGKSLREQKNQTLAQNVTLFTDWNPSQNFEEWSRQTLNQTDSESITLTLAGLTPEGQGAIGFREDQKIQIESFQSYYRSSELAERMRHEITEVALKKWCLWLESTTH